MNLIFRISGNKILDAVDLDTPPFKRETFGFWVDVPKGVAHTMRTKGLHPAEGIHSAEHAVLNRFSLKTELRTECKILEKEYAEKPSSRRRPARLIFYDSAGKQSGGVSAKAFDHGEKTSFRHCLLVNLMLWCFSFRFITFRA